MHVCAVIRLPHNISFSCADCCVLPCFEHDIFFLFVCKIIERRRKKKKLEVVECIANEPRNQS